MAATLQIASSTPGGVGIFFHFFTVFKAADSPPLETLFETKQISLLRKLYSTAELLLLGQMVVSKISV